MESACKPSTRVKARFCTSLTRACTSGTGSLAGAQSCSSTSRPTLTRTRSATGRTAAALAQAADIIRNTDVCDDLYGVAQNQPEEYLTREAKVPAEIPQDVAIELAKLDENEFSSALTTPDGQFLRLIMLCGRTALASEEISRDSVAEQLRQARLNGLANSYLEQLRAEARIVRQ